MPWRFNTPGISRSTAYRLMSEGERPPLIVSNYGSDIFLFGQFPEHQQRIRELLAATDVYHCECAPRYRAWARPLGFAAQVAPTMPMGGGWDLDAAAVFRTPPRRPAAGLSRLRLPMGWAGAGSRLKLCATALTCWTATRWNSSWRRAMSRGRPRLTRETGLL